MKKIIKTLLLVMVVVLALTVFVACEKEEPEVPTCAHQGGKATCTEAPVCELCGESYGEALGHKGGTSTCSALGICATCGAEYGELKAHTPEYFADEYFCDKEGLSAGSSCSVCGAVIRKRFPLAPTGHKMTEGSCTEDSVCLNAGCDYVVAAPGHTMVDVEGKAPTCTEEGHTAYTACECGHTEGYEVLPAGHVIGEDGVCTGCGNVIVTTGDELIAAMATGKNVLLANDIVMDATLKCPYGNDVGVAQKGGVLDGNGFTLTVNGNGGYYAIITYGGTIKNLTINAGFRAIVLYTPTEDVIIDNVTIYGDDIVYGLNTAEYPTLEGIDIVVKNSTICGWVSFAGDYASVSFEGCDFVQGVAYDNTIGRLVKPYLSTTFTNCSFVKNAYLDLSALGAGETVTLVGCTVDGVDVTVDVFTTTENDAEIPFTYEAPAGVEMAPVAIEGGVSFHRHAHSYEEVVTAPTCTAAGYTTYTCACGDTYTEAGAAATGHDYIEDVLNPTCTAAGTRTFECSVCFDSYDETIPALGHADNNGDFKCDGCSTKMLPEKDSTLTFEQVIAISKLTTTTDKYYVTGTIVKVLNTTYGNMLITDGTNEFEIRGLFSADGSVRYDAMTNKPVAGDEITIYAIISSYNGAPQMGSNDFGTWLVAHVSHEHNYTSEVIEPGCSTVGYTTYTCSICGGSYTDNEVDALGHTTQNGECERCGLTIGGTIPVVELLAQFKMGTATTDSSSAKTSYSEQVGSYKLSITGKNMYDGYSNNDSALKFGKSGECGTGKFTVPANITKVVIYVAMFNNSAEKTVMKINGTQYTISTSYKAIEITQPTEGAEWSIELTGIQNSKNRFYVGTIEYYGYAQ